MRILENIVVTQGQRAAIVLMNMTQDVLRVTVGRNDQAAIFDAVLAQQRLMMKVASWPEKARARICVIDVRSSDLERSPFTSLLEQAQSMRNYRFFEFTPMAEGGLVNNYVMADEPVTMIPSEDLPLRTYQKGDSLDLVLADMPVTLSEFIELNGLNHFFVMGQGAENSVAQMTRRLARNAAHEVYVALSYSITLISAPGEDNPLTAAAAKLARKQVLYNMWLKLLLEFKNLKLIEGFTGYYKVLVAQKELLCQ